MTGDGIREGARGAAPARARLGAVALLLGASVLLSRVLGWVREMVLAYRMGAGAETDAFYAAFQIPDLLNYFLAGGALSIAFIPLYTRARAEQGDAAAERLAATVLGTLGAAVVVATILLWWNAEALVALQFPAFDAEKRALTTRLTRIVLPAQIFFITGGIVQGVLLARERFRAAALAPLLYNAGVILGGLLLAPFIGIDGFSWGALAGAIAGPFLAPVIASRRAGLSLRVRLAPADRAFLGYLVVAAPLMFGQSLLTVDEWYDRWFGALLSEGTVSHLAYARRLMLVPVAVVGQALAAAALPTLARLHAEGRTAALHRVVLQTLRAALALGVVATAGFATFAEPVTRLVYQRGAFTADDAAVVSALLAVLSLAVPGWVVQQVASRAFFARGDTWRPMLLSTGIALAVIPLYLALGRRFGALGLAAAGALGVGINAAATLGWARVRHGGPSLRRLGATTGRVVAIALLAAKSALALHPAPGVAGAAAAAGGAGAGPEGALLALLLAWLPAAAAFTATLVLAVPMLGDRSVREATQRLLARVVRRGRRA